MKKIRVFVEDANTKWSEDYTVEDDVKPSTFGKELIDNFNKNLRSHETKRTFVKAKVLWYSKKGAK